MVSAVATLPLKQAWAYALVEWWGYTAKESTARMECSRQQVERLLAGARKRLALALIADRGKNPPTRVCISDGEISDKFPLKKKSKIVFVKERGRFGIVSVRQTTTTENAALADTPGVLEERFAGWRWKCAARYGRWPSG